MTTRVTVKVEGNRPMFIGTRQGSHVSAEVTTSGVVTREFWVHGNLQVIAREATEQEIADRA